MFIDHTVQFLILGFHKISCQFFFFPLYSSLKMVTGHLLTSASRETQFKFIFQFVSIYLDIAPPHHTLSNAGSYSSTGDAVSKFQAPLTVQLPAHKVFHGYSEKKCYLMPMKITTHQYEKYIAFYFFWFILIFFFFFRTFFLLRLSSSHYYIKNW